MNKKNAERILPYVIAELIKHEIAEQLAAQKQVGSVKAKKTKLLTQKELTEELSLSLATLHRYRNKGMPFHQPEPGMKIHYDLEEVKIWIGGDKYAR